MMNYEKRLLKAITWEFLTNNKGAFFTAVDYASMWKRSKVDIEIAAQALLKRGKIKIGKDGVLSLR